MTEPTDKERILKLEITQGFFAKRLNLLEDQGKAFAKSLTDITTQLKLIKWIAIAFALGYIAKDIGLFELIKGVIL